MIHIDKLRFYYEPDKIILDEVSLEFAPGNIYGLFGKNGEGKSTLMKLMSGLRFPLTGHCNMLGERIEKRTVKCLQQVFLVPEDFELSAVPITTYEKVNSVFYPDFSKSKFYELIQEFGLSKKEKIPTLSFGQKKKVLIAFGIAANTKLLLMDEPTNGLDIPSKSQFRKIMASAVDEGKCIIISTHQVRDLHSLINHVIILDGGKVVFDNPLTRISEKLWFGKSNEADHGSIIYSEATFGGKTVLERGDRDESEVDLEVLFNAVASRPQQINKVI